MWNSAHYTGTETETDDIVCCTQFLGLCLGLGFVSVITP